MDSEAEVSKLHRNAPKVDHDSDQYIDQHRVCAHSMEFAKLLF